MREAETHVRLKLQRGMMHNDEILEKIGNLHCISLCELGELVLPIQKLLREVLSTEQVGSKHDFPKI